MNIPTRGFAVGLFAGLMCLPASWAEEVILQNSEVKESALIEALAVEEPMEEPTAEHGLTRGFKPAKRPEASKPLGPGKASLLITFLTSSANLTSDSQAALDTVARALQSDELARHAFRVEGHADARGSAALNQKLSEARAEAVARYLIERHGIPPERLHPEGKGASEPMNKARVDAPENRRVTLVTLRK